jgi:hypothetical protein
MLDKQIIHIIIAVAGLAWRRILTGSQYNNEPDKGCPNIKRYQAVK